MISHLGAMLPVADGLALAAQLRGRAAGGRGLHRRRRDERGRLPRGAEPRGGVEAAGALRDREQPVRALDARRRAVRLPGPRGPRRRLRHAGRGVDGNDVLAVVPRGAPRRPRARARGGGPDAARVQDVPDARPRGGVGHRLRPEGARRGVGAEGPDRCASRPTSLETRRLRRGRARRDPRRSSRRASTRWWTRRWRRRSRARRAEREAGRRLRAEPPRPASPPRPRPRPTPRAALRRRDQRRPARGDARATRARSCSSGRTSPSTAASSRSPRASSRSSARRACATRRSSSRARSARRSGLALDGFVPMVEMQFGDFITCGFNQIVNNLAKTHYRWGGARARRDPRARRRRHGRGALPLAERRGVVHARRRPQGRGARDAVRRQGAAARGLRGRQPRPLSSSTRSSTARPRGRVPEGYYTMPIGQARVARAGRDATVVTYGVGVAWALEAAARAGAGGREIEVDRPALARCPGTSRRCVASVREDGPRASCCTRRRSPAGSAARSRRRSGREAFEWLDAPGRAPGRARHAGALREGARGDLLAEGPAAAGAAGAAGVLSLRELLVC